ELLIAEDVDRDRLRTRRLQQAQTDEKPAVVHADLGDGSRHLFGALRRVERVDDDENLGLHEACDEPVSDGPVAIQILLHRLAAYCPSNRFRSAASFCSTMSAKSL